MSMLIGDSSRQLQIVPGPRRVANLLPPTHDHQPSLARLPPVKRRSVEYKASLLVRTVCCSGYVSVFSPAYISRIGLASLQYNILIGMGMGRIQKV